MIAKRGPFEILEQNTPWLTERMVCGSCGHEFTLLRTLGDSRCVPCSFCKQYNNEPAEEAPRFVPTKQ
jgi:hypothetical protein